MPTKQIIFNDPVYGFIRIPAGIIFQLIEHPYFQRLRRIKQLGLTHLIYPGALHTRFQHALGAVHLMREALYVLQRKGHHITKEEARAALLAILLHDIGHGPFSHTLERSIVSDLHHEGLSLLFMQHLNKVFDGELDLAIRIFRNKHKKKFLNQLVSSQLDVDRLDYLNRDSFFTGVHEGVIGYDRIIKMLEVHNDELVVEEKGIYSIENFIIARRLMYWQVYLHKTVLAAEQMMVRILQRAKKLVQEGADLFVLEPLDFFLRNKISLKQLESSPELLDRFARLDDFDIIFCIKQWADAKDPVLAQLCSGMINRRLPRIHLRKSSFSKSELEQKREEVVRAHGVSAEVARHLVFTDSTTNSAYDSEQPHINILYKDGTLQDIATASDQLNISVLSKPVKKYYICFPKPIKE